MFDHVYRYTSYGAYTTWTKLLSRTMLDPDKVYVIIKPWCGVFYKLYFLCTVCLISCTSTHNLCQVTRYVICSKKFCIRTFSYRPKGLRLQRNLLMPKAGTVYKFVYLFRNFGSWHNWSSLVTPRHLDNTYKVKTHFIWLSN